MSCWEQEGVVATRHRSSDLPRGGGREMEGKEVGKASDGAVTRRRDGGVEMDTAEFRGCGGGGGERA